MAILANEFANQLTRRQLADLEEAQNLAEKISFVGEEIKEKCENAGIKIDYNVAVSEYTGFSKIERSMRSSKKGYSAEISIHKNATSIFGVKVGGEKDTYNVYKMEECNFPYRININGDRLEYAQNEKAILLRLKRVVYATALTPDEGAAVSAANQTQPTSAPTLAQ
jgi:hypothetical protein